MKHLIIASIIACTFTLSAQANEGQKLSPEFLETITTGLAECAGIYNTVGIVKAQSGKDDAQATLEESFEWRAAAIFSAGMLHEDASYTELEQKVDAIIEPTIKRYRVVNNWKEMGDKLHNECAAMQNIQVQFYEAYIDFTRKASTK